MLHLKVFRKWIGKNPCTMSNEIKLCLSLSFILPNHEITCCVFLHWFEFSFYLKLELILSKITLLSFPDSLFAGLIDRHFRLFSKFSLWSFKYINASRFSVIRSILSQIPNLLEISFNSESISSIKSSDPCLYVFVMLSCKKEFVVCGVQWRFVNVSSFVREN
jgi:hypothetical protein